MHRRAVLELSRRQGIKPKTPVFYPIPICASRHSFHSSLPTYNSSQSAFSTNGDANNDGNDKTTSSSPSPSPPRKFGGRWGANLKAQGSVALTPEEQQIRENVLAKQKQAEQEAAKKEAAIQAKKVKREKNRAHRAFPTDSRHAKAPWTYRQDDRLRARNRLQANVIHIPYHIRRRDWVCPDCRHHCYGKHPICPMCRAVRPELLPEAEKAGQLGDSGQRSTNLKDLGSPASSDLERPHSATDRMSDKEKNTRYLESLISDSNSRRDRYRQSDRDTQVPEGSENEGQTTEAPTWSWDISSLDKMEIQPDDSSKGALEKFRDSRKQRDSRFDEDFTAEDLEERQRRREERMRLKRDKARQKDYQKVQNTDPSPLYLPEFITVSNLANVVGVRPGPFVERMEEMGFEGVTYNHVLDAETAGLIATEFNFEPIFDTAVEDNLTPAPEPEDKSVLPPRPPVVTIMGHVDHGKTTILDWLRNTSIAASEHGGITQHIGAFSVAMPSGKTITFLDTPGHSAFLEMRRRGADVTDIVVLVVAADDSVKPQTLEAIKHATEAKVPVIVAISKMDKEGVNPEKVKQDLAVHGINVEDYGGDVQAVGVSGKTGLGMLDLEEAIITQSEILDHRADVEGAVEGWVLEASTKTHGRVATVLVRRGTLQPGDIVVAGTTWARVRTLRNEAGVSISEATPGTPVEIDGWREQPLAGTEILQAPDEQRAKTAVEWRQERTETERLSEDMTAINQARRETIEKRRQEEARKQLRQRSSDSSGEGEQEKGPKPIHFIIKADVSGSAEAVMNSIAAIGNNEVFANVLRSGVGPVGEFDIEHAATAGGRVVSFNMPIDHHILRMAELQGVKVLDHNVIYKLVDDVKTTLSEYLAPNVSHRVVGEAVISQIFEITVKGRAKTSIAGCRVRNGVINRSKNVRVYRGQDIIYDGSISSLRNVKKDVSEMRKDTECGVSFGDWTGFAVDDRIQCYENIYEKRYL